MAKLIVVTCVDAIKWNMRAASVKLRFYEDLAIYFCVRKLIVEKEIIAVGRTECRAQSRSVNLKKN